MADKPKVKPSSAGVWIGLVMMLLSFASCGAGCVLAGSEIKDAADAAQRVDVPASQTYDMEADAAGIIIGLAPSASDAKDIEVSLTDENGTAVEVSTSSSFSSSTTESKGDSVEVLGTFEVKKAGTYTLNATGPAGTRVAILNISIGAILGKFFGGIGIVSGLLGVLVGLYLTVVKLVYHQNIGDRPLLLLAVLLVILGVNFLSMGFLGELVVRSYHEAQDKPIYTVRRVLDAAGDPTPAAPLRG